jgi:hypothetical protein
VVLEKLKSLLQLQWVQSLRQPIVWLPSVLLPLFALGLWGYLAHPEWIEGTVEENVSTGEAITTDPTSPVTEADLSLDDLSTVAEADSVSSILQQINLNSPAQANSDSKEQSKEAKGDPNAKSGEASAQAKQDPKAATKDNDRKPNIEANNLFASAIQAFLNGGSVARSTNEQGPLGFAPILSAFGAKQNSEATNGLQQALLELDRTESAETTAEDALPLIPANLNLQEPASLSGRSGQTPYSVGQASSSSLAGSAPYIPGQIPYILPGSTRSPQPAASGFITPTPGGATYYPNQRGTGGYSVTPGGTTFSRQRGTTGSVVTPQGIIGPRQRGTTGSVVTPQGTVYTRQRGSTGFTQPPVSTTTPNSPTNPFPSPGGTTAPNPFQPTPLGNSTQFNNQNNSN